MQDGERHRGVRRAQRGRYICVVSTICPSEKWSLIIFYSYFVLRTHSGGVNQLTTYDLKGNILDSLQNNDWFVLQKIPSTVSHITFHPHRIMLAYSLIDCSVIVSSLLPKKRISSTNN